MDIGCRLVGWMVFAGLPVMSEAAAQFVQVNDNAPLTTVTSVAAPYSSIQFPGDLNVVIISWEASTGSVQSVVDSAGNVYSVAAGPTALSGIASQTIYFAPNIVGAAAGTNTVTVTFAAGVPHPDLRIAEYSGVNPAHVLDVAVGSSGTSTNTTSGPATTSNANDILVGGNVVAHSTTGPGTGYSQRVLTSHADILEDMSVNATGSYSATAPQSPSGWFVMQMAAFESTPSSPFPASPILGGITWDYTTKHRFATGSQCPSMTCGAGAGSDIWDSAWGSDGSIYSSFGDGAGFNSTTQQYQIGISQINGSTPSLTGTDVFYGSPKGGCVVAPPGAIGGKPGGLAALAGKTLYMFHDLSQVSINGTCGGGAWLSKSTNLGPSMTVTDHVGSISWPDANGFGPSAVLQYGPGQQGALAPDSTGTAYIYIYGGKGKGKGTYLARVSAAGGAIESLANWSYFSGMVNGVAQWSSSSANAAPVFYDPNNAESLLVTFDAAIGRYLAYNDHGIPSERQLSLFDAPSPWGPWTTFDYEENFDNNAGCSPCLANGSGVGFTMMQKFFGTDGLSMWPLYSSDQNGYDSLNIVKGTMSLSAGSTVSGLSVSTHTPAVLDRLSTKPPGNLEYIDRTYQLTAIPAAYQGLEMIRLANNDKTASSSQPYISFTNTVQQSVCVGWDTSNPVPSWIDGTWTNTHNTLTGNATFNVYKKVFAAGSVTLNGANAPDVFILFVGC